MFRRSKTCHGGHCTFGVPHNLGCHFADFTNITGGHIFRGACPSLLLSRNFPMVYWQIRNIFLLVYASIWSGSGGCCGLTIYWPRRICDAYQTIRRTSNSGRTPPGHVGNHRSHSSQSTFKVPCSLEASPKELMLTAGRALQVLGFCYNCWLCPYRIYILGRQRSSSCQLL